MTIADSKAPPSQPLHGLTALVLASAEKSPPLCRALEALGASAIPFPTIELRKVSPNPALDLALRRLQEYDWMIFTSSYSARFFLDHPRGDSPPTTPANRPCVCAVGTATAKVLHDRGWNVDLVPAEFAAEGVIEALIARLGGTGRIAGLRFLLPGARAARQLIPDELTRLGASVEAVTLYENVLPGTDPAVVRRIAAVQPDLLVCTSPSTVRNFIRILGAAPALEILRTAVIAVLGPVTAAEVARLCRTPDIVPAVSTLPSLGDSILQYYSRKPAD